METDLLQKLGAKIISKEELMQKVENDLSILPEVLKGTSSSKAAVRYGCTKVLMNMSEKYPEAVYPYFENFVMLLSNKYRILTWNAIAIIANLTKVDKEHKFDQIFGKYYDLLNSEYMVTVANVVGNSAKIALAKPYLTDRITCELLKVDRISLTPHLTEECRRVIIQKAIESFDLFFDKITQKERVISFVKKHTNSSRRTLKETAGNFLKKWTE